MASTYGSEDEPAERPAKRRRTSYDADTLGLSSTHTYGNTTINTPYMVVMGNHVQHRGQDPRNHSVTANEDKYNILLKSLLFDRIDFRVNNTWYAGGSLDEHNGFLWIKGKPGCGKSTLMKAALDWARKRKRKNRVRPTIVPYFFSARASASLEKSALGLYRTVVHHLLSSCDFLRPLFMDRFALKDPGQSGEKWTAEELQVFLFDAVESNEPWDLCLFIDALDEAEYEDDVRHMISFLVQLSDRALALHDSCKLQICLSSRHYPHISIGRGLSLVVEDQPQHGQDIEIYITKQLTCLDGPEKDELRFQISHKSARIFLWVVLVVEMLNRLDDYGAPLSDMKARLETIPADLNDLFRDILLKSDHGIETSVLLFQWSVFAMRPLEPVELFVAMEYSRSPSDLAWTPPSTVSPPSADRLAKCILNYSRGLVEVVEVASGQPPVVQFIHEAVREFLLKDNGLASIVPALAANLVGISHEILRIACFRCISAHNASEEYQHYCDASHKNNTWKTFRSSMRLKLPFLDYAILHLFDHAEGAQKHDIPQQAFLAAQMDEHGYWKDSYRHWWNVLKNYQSQKVEADVTLLYFVAERQNLGLVAVLLNVLNTASRVCGERGTVLQLASRRGYEQVVQMLLGKGADVNAKGGRYGNALQAASWGGHKKVVQILLDKGADVHAQGRHFVNALHAASAGGHKKTVQMLVEQGARARPV
ncbi:hypothetical protein H2198_002035 [Neophaeococcomyces mojaviensis]|uniref:Uncharacterized protein n=1 Tax=Neophaeococcomyces mojaviensis TaxID=3383035 RepID=A0ACC3AF95_9EURO|nr:hypothetical protein H2198_002035 [Knufia sp. JES_112]